MSAASNPRPPAARRPSRLVVCLLLLCLSLAGLDLALVGRNRDLRAQVVELQEQVDRARRPPLPALEGRAFPALELVDARGEVFGLTELLDTHATLLFVSSPACDYCVLARPLWERTARGLAGAPLRVVELILEPEAGAGAAYSGLIPRLTAGGAEDVLLRSIPGLPAALLLDSRGVVLRATYGAEQEGLEQIVEEHLARVAALSAR